MQKDFFSKAQICPAPLHSEGGDDLVAAKRLSNCSTPEARALVAYQTANHLKILPLAILDLNGATKTFTAAAAPVIDDFERLKMLKFCTNMQIRLIPVAATILKEAIFKAYFGDDSTLRVCAEQAQAAVKEEPHSDSFEVGEHGEAATFLSGLIEYGVSHQASDIHFIPTQDGALLRLRIDGELRENCQAVNTKKLHQQLVSRIKVLAKLPLGKTFSPLDGAFKIEIAEKRISIRVSIMPTIHGEKAVLRILGQSKVVRLEQLNLNARIRIALEEAALTGEGAIIFSGPTGSGKTSSAYAVLALLRDKAKNIITIEDPVEIMMDGISQTSVSEILGLGFSAGLISALRQDPDVVLLGEIREAEVAQLALNMALTGHLLLSTIHARSVLDIPLRLSNFGVDNALLAQSLTLLVSQRLLPRLCNQCKVLDLTASNHYGFDVYQGTGCAACDYSGYAGRIVAVEALSIDDDIRSALANGFLSAKDLKKVTTSQNYFPMAEDLLALLKEGSISEKSYQERAGRVLQFKR